MANGERKGRFSVANFLKRPQKSEASARSSSERPRLSAEDVWNFLQASQEFQEKVRADRDHFDIFIGDEPIRIEFMSDLHLGSTIMDRGSVRARIDYIINTPGVFVIFGGDVIDGVNKEYVDTIGEQAAISNIMAQAEAFKAAVFYPLHKAGKVLGAVSGFGGHEEWVRKATGVPPSKLLYDDAIPYLENGGEARVYEKGTDPKESNPDLTFDLAHNDGAGNNPQDAFKGQRSGLAVKPNLDGLASGHNHSVAAVGEVMSPGKRSVVHLKEGTDKGNNIDQRDRLIVRDHPHSTVRRGGTGFIVYRGQNEVVVPVPAEDPEAAELDTAEPQEVGNYIVLPAFNNYSPELAGHTFTDTTFDAIRLWDWAVRTGDLDAILEQFREGAKGYNATLIKSRSEGSTFSGDPTTHWGKVQYKVRPENSELIGAVKLDLFNGARVPSKRTMWDEIKARSTELANDPFAFALVLREMFDKSMAKNPNKEHQFERLMRAMQPGLESGRVLGWLQSGSMRDDNWGEFLPGKEIDERYDIPLLNNYSSVILSMPRGPEFALLLLDTSRNNSNTNIFHGQYNAMQRHPGHDMIIGGKSTQSGYQSYRDADQSIKHILIPGWLNQETNIGEKGAWEPAPTNHAAVIFNMLTGEIEIGLTEEEVRDLYAAVQLWMALSQTPEGVDYYLKAMRPQK